MILAESLIYKLDQRLNKLSSNEHQQIPLEDKILVLQECEILLVKRKLNPVNNLRVGFEGNKKRYEDLQFLVEPHTDHELTLEVSDSKLNRWTASILNLDPVYMFYVDSYITADKGVCKDRVVWVNSDLTATANITILLNNSNYKPSFEYQETFCDLSSNEIGIFTDGTFTPKKLYLSYIRYPVPVDMEGYIKFDGSDSETVNSELPAYMEDELLDAAAEKIAMYTENLAAAQSAQVRAAKEE
jgi:hypothetical protein